jgi:hypothetical protein
MPTPIPNQAKNLKKNGKEFYQFPNDVLRPMIQEAQSEIHLSTGHINSGKKQYTPL